MKKKNFFFHVLWEYKIVRGGRSQPSTLAPFSRFLRNAEKKETCIENLHVPGTMFVCLYVCLSIHQSIYYLSIYLFNYLSVYLSNYLPIYLELVVP